MNTCGAKMAGGGDGAAERQRRSEGGGGGAAAGQPEGRRRRGGRGDRSGRRREGIQRSRERGAGKKRGESVRENEWEIKRERAMRSAQRDKGDGEGHGGNTKESVRCAPGRRAKRHRKGVGDGKCSGGRGVSDGRDVARGSFRERLSKVACVWGHGLRKASTAGRPAKVRARQPQGPARRVAVARRGEGRREGAPPQTSAREGAPTRRTVRTSRTEAGARRARASGAAARGGATSRVES